MLFFLVLIAAELLSFPILKEHIGRRSKGLLFISTLIHVIFSIWLWFILYKTMTYPGFYDEPDHMRLAMDLSEVICAVVIPRYILIIFHYTGKLIRIRRGGYIRWLTGAGFLSGALFFTIIILSTLYGRFNFKTENVEVKVRELNPDLDGLRIVQISDLHLSSFHGHHKALRSAINTVNSLRPDLLINTGDFVSFGWREFDSYDTILARAVSVYGSYAVAGNHDFGIYHPHYTPADRENSVLLLNERIRRSGYTLLNDTSIILNIGSAKLGLTGIRTMGKTPNIRHGDVQKALKGTENADFRILLSHDPNQWEPDVVSKTNIDLTLSGHTHGMQLGIYTRWFRWSPAVFFYPHWGGLYREGNQYHYVNRGLGVLSVPFRIWMPPEITLITLKRE